MISENTRLQFYLFMNGEFPIGEFEQWVYSTDELEKQLPPQDYLDLISFDFNQRGATYELKAIIKKHINQTDFDYWLIQKLLNDLITSKGDSVYIIDALNDFYFSGFLFLKNVVLTDMDDFPRLIDKPLWNKEVFETKRKELDVYLNASKQEAIHLLKIIDEANIQDYQDDPNWFSNKIWS
jgi:hypothetical protein